MQTDYTILALNLIEHERKKQLAKHSREADRSYTDGDLPMAAATYALYGIDVSVDDGEPGAKPMEITAANGLYPWPMESFKPSYNPLKNAVVAAALLTAEIERLIGEYSDTRNPAIDQVRDVIMSQFAVARFHDGGPVSAKEMPLVGDPAEQTAPAKPGPGGIYQLSGDPTDRPALYLVTPEGRVVNGNYPIRFANNGETIEYGSRPHAFRLFYWREEFRGRNYDQVLEWARVELNNPSDVPTPYPWDPATRLANSYAREIAEEARDDTSQSLVAEKRGKTKGCAARQQSDQMYCSKCLLTWDVNDLDPPQCGAVANTSADPSK